MRLVLSHLRSAAVLSCSMLKIPRRSEDFGGNVLAAAAAEDGAPAVEMYTPYTFSRFSLL